MRQNTCAVTLVVDQAMPLFCPVTFTYTIHMRKKGDLAKVCVYGGVGFTQTVVYYYSVRVLRYCITPVLQRIDDVQFLILDEADELLTPNFKEQIKLFLENCPKSKQMMLFSATMPRDIKDVVKRSVHPVIPSVIFVTLNTLWPTCLSVIKDQRSGAGNEASHSTLLLFGDSMLLCQPSAPH